MSRTTNSIKNIQFSFVGQILSIVLSFITRTFFINILGSQYLGLNGLFTNILSILSFAELGVGSAIIYSLYKPLAENNKSNIRALLHLYKKIYVAIGIGIILLGFSLTPFLELFIDEAPNIQNFKLIYILFVLNSGISYFFSYKRSLLVADQKKYIEAFYYYVFFIIRNIFQIASLLLTQNYIVYLLIQLAMTVLENLYISSKVNQLYPFLKGRQQDKLNRQDKDIIKKNIKALIFHRIGSIAVTGTDNILISKFINIGVVGLYSNYLLIINTINQIASLLFQSVTANIGNLGVTSDNLRKEFIFRSIDFFGYWFFTFSSISLIVLLNPFINLWIGSDYIFDLSTVLIIVSSYYLTGLRKSVLTFRDALGLFWFDRFKPLIEAGINLGFSIFLGQKFGLNGIVFGTIISTLLTCSFVEPFILYKYGFNSSVKKYYINFILRIVITIAIGFVTVAVSGLYHGNIIVEFIYKILICTFIPNTLLTFIFFRSDEFKYLFSQVHNPV